MSLEDPGNTHALIVGSGSMIGQALLAQSRAGLSMTGVSHTGFADVDLAAYDVVINMAYDPRHMREAYDPARDFDLRVAQAVARAGRHFVMVSTRKVYGPIFQFPVTEDAPKAPSDSYGRNKLETEGRVSDLLGPNCTILRLANVFDFEPDRHTFFGIALSRLRRENRIVLDTSPRVRKDFIPLSDCAFAMASVLPHKPAGAFNLGYGTATEIGQLAMWLIEGYGRGELVATSTEIRDEFLLDVGKLANLIGMREGRTSVRDRCLEIGERLRHA